MMRKITEGWKIFILGVVFSLFSWLFIELIFPYIKDKFLERHPNTYIYTIGQEYSYTIDQLKTTAPIRSIICLRPVKFPQGITSVSNSDIPIKFFNWTYPKNTKLYTITAQNKGEGIDKNIKIDIDFTPFLIKSIKIHHEKRVSLIQGGEPEFRAVFKIEELLPGENQDIEILLKGKKIKSLDAWSELEQNLKYIFIIDLSIEPDTTFLK